MGVCLEVSLDTFGWIGEAVNLFPGRLWPTELVCRKAAKEVPFLSDFFLELSAKAWGWGQMGWGGRENLEDSSRELHLAVVWRDKKKVGEGDSAR